MPLSPQLAPQSGTVPTSGTRKLAGQHSGGLPAVLHGLTGWSCSGGTALTGSSSPWIAMKTPTEATLNNFVGQPSCHQTKPPSGSKHYWVNPPDTRQAPMQLPF